LEITNGSKKELLNICDYSVRKLLSYIEKFKLLNKKIDMKNVKTDDSRQSGFDGVMST